MYSDTRKQIKDKTSYREHYEKCREHFKHNNSDICDLTISEELETTKEYYDLIKSLNEKVIESLKNRANYNVDTFRHGIKDALEFPEVHKIHDYFYEQISNNFFSSNYTSNRIQICKNIPTNAELKSSWLWHYDDNGPPHIKLFIYLSDVISAFDGAFCYAVDENNETKKIDSSRIGPKIKGSQFFLRSRVPTEFIDSNKLKEKYLIGKRGKCFLFDPNIIHKATVPLVDHERLALIYHYHPTMVKTSLFNFIHTYVKDYMLR